MIQTFSVFYYGTTVTDTNFTLPFNEGAGELNAELEFGGYSLSEIVTELKRVLDAAGTQEYTVSVDRDTRFITISAASAFDLLLGTGTTIGTSVFELIGFTQGTDLTGATSYTGASPAGKSYEPQTPLQNYVSKDDWQNAAQGTVHKSASGAVETVTFGIEKFYEMNIKWANDFNEHSDFIKGRTNGVQQLREFMQAVTQKGRFEFMPDIDDRSTFDKVILESTPGSRNGIGYKLKELFDQNVSGYFETGVIKLRVVE